MRVMRRCLGWLVCSDLEARLQRSQGRLDPIRVSIRRKQLLQQKQMDIVVSCIGLVLCMYLELGFCAKVLCLVGQRG